MHLAWRWFTGLGFDQEIPHHSTFSKNRHGRFQESKLFEELFEHIVRQCVEVGLVQGKHLSVDGSFVEANADRKSTRLNSSHRCISYAVFCLKKKMKTYTITNQDSSSM